MFTLINVLFSVTEAADMYHAEDLLKHCQLFREDNISELKVLSQS
jgi:hypothetical protein